MSMIRRSMDDILDDKTISFVVLKVFLAGSGPCLLLIVAQGPTSKITWNDHTNQCPDDPGASPTTSSCAGKEFYHIITKRWWKYILWPLVDREQNYLVKAYQIIDSHKLQLLDCITIPVVILLSFLILRTRYRIIHIVGVVTCIAGLGALIGADVLSGRASSGDSAPSNKLLGDIFCLLGASLYGVSNVAQEYVVRQYTRTEFLGMVGLFGTFVSGIQLVALERQELASFSWNIEAILLLLGFAACMFCLYSFFPVVIQWSSATVVNLSILTADMYTLIIGIFVFHFAFSGLYLFGFGLIFAGVILYSLRPTKDSPAGPRSYSLFHNNQSSENITHIRVQDDDDDAAAGTTTTLTDGVDIEGATPRDDDTEQLHKEFSKSLNGDSN
eukprot:XP_011671411.1 PREDICTED: LOW QUALITY PROTEIN: solute carrier family 35 member F2-like [Strongylocentrotus purpuratus]